jgi:hypothetical protein
MLARQVSAQPLQQLLAVNGPRIPLLLELDDAPPTTYRARSAKRAVPEELLGLRDDADEAATHAHAMAMRQAVGHMARGATCAGASPVKFSANDCLSSV